MDDAIREERARRLSRYNKLVREQGNIMNQDQPLYFLFIREKDGFDMEIDLEISQN